MSTADDDRQVERFVAGIPADEEALAGAISARAVERAIVVKVLLDALASSVARTRLAAARRIARMPCVAPPVAARLMLVVIEDDDDGVRAASTAALWAHGLPVPGDPRHGARDDAGSP